MVLNGDIDIFRGRKFQREMEDERGRPRERFEEVKRVKRVNGVRRWRSLLENRKRKVEKVVVNFKNRNKF